MSSRAILGLACVGGLVVSMAAPAFAQTTPTGTTTNSTTTTTTTTPATTTTKTNPPNCPPGTPVTKTNPTATNTPTTATDCTNTTTTPATTPETEPMTGTTNNFNALNNNPNGSDWLAKFNRPTVKSTYLGTTTRLGKRCRYVMEYGRKMKVCK